MFVITDRDRHHLLLQAQAAMGEPTADTLMASLYPADPSELVTKEYLGLRLDAAVARLQAVIAETVTRLETKIAETHTKIAETDTKIEKTHTKMWRIAFMLLFGQAILPPIVERLLEKL